MKKLAFTFLLISKQTCASKRKGLCKQASRIVQERTQDYARTHASFCKQVGLCTQASKQDFASEHAFASKHAKKTNKTSLFIAFKTQINPKLNPRKPGKLEFSWVFNL